VIILELNHVINGHRSIREYEDREISQELLEQILDAGIRASSSGNMQAYSISFPRLIKTLHSYQKIVLKLSRSRKWFLFIFLN
jgi:nitroreductase